MFKLTCILVLSFVAVLAEFPSSVNRCHEGDNDCLAKTTQDVMSRLYGGLRELNLLPFDPLRVNSLVLERIPSSPVNLELKFKDLDLYGLKDIHVKTVKGFTFKERSEYESIIPELIMKGKYSADGRVLILPIVGNGDCVITITKVHLKFSFDLKPVEKNGQTYAQLEHVKLEFKPDLVQFKFDNLFNGDKALGENMNKFINGNWRDIYTELESGFSKALGLVAKQMFNNVFGKFPYEELILPN